MNVNGKQHCPSCDGSNVRSELIDDKFLYGVGPNPIKLSAHVRMFTCNDCGVQYSGEQGEAARAAAVHEYLYSIVPQLVQALKAQHHAIDVLFALLIAKTMHGEKPFYPSESGQPWEAIKAGKAAIEAAGGEV
jgi:hypothetical protein